jgi:two-component system NtrC family sensor kinase
MTMTLDILVIDDQQAILDDFRRLLVAEDPAHDAALDELAALIGQAPVAPSTVQLPMFRLHTAKQGLAGVDRHAQLCAAGSPPSVAFVDIHMPPGIDGVETVTRLWAAQPDLEIVLCTAYSDYSWHNILERLERREQFLILRKPFDPVEVRQLAACLSEKWRRGRELAMRMDDLEAKVAREVARRLDIELQNAQKFETLGRLSAGITHEISTPLQYVQSNLEAISSMVDDMRGALAAAPPDLATANEMLGEMPGALADAFDGVQRMTSIVRSVRQFAHTRQQRTLELVDVNAQIGMVVALARSEYKHHAEIALELQQLPRVPGDADLIGRALLNLLVNSAHAIRARGGPLGRITIRSRAADGGIAVDIVDPGVGIPRELQRRVFEPFFTTKPRGQGTGQGLAMVHDAIVDVHHGRVTFESEPGIGTTFHLWLPAGQSGANAGVAA